MLTCLHADIRDSCLSPALLCRVLAHMTLLWSSSFWTSLILPLSGTSGSTKILAPSIPGAWAAPCLTYINLYALACPPQHYVCPLSLSAFLSMWSLTGLQCLQWLKPSKVVTDCFKPVAMCVYQVVSNKKTTNYKLDVACSCCSTASEWGWERGYKISAQTLLTD